LPDGEENELRERTARGGFTRDKSLISKHLKNIFEEGELVRDSVVAQNATTAADGKTYQVNDYRLEAVLAVG
jgi:hypothetical protein